MTNELNELLFNLNDIDMKTITYKQYIILDQYDEIF